MTNVVYNNPIIKGFNPDPSICRVGEDFYLVTSTFEFFPGVPVYHSNNLVEWELINHCLTRESQLPLKDCSNSGGIYAPTLRYHDGTFYMVTTNVSGVGNFYVTTEDIYGEWSEPIPVDQDGIDPSLYFEGDKTYFCSTGNDDEGKSCILLCEIDSQTGEKTAPTTIISYGTGGRCPEAPHIYKRGSYYYLILAEGGTEYGHMTTILRSTSPYGPYESCPHNPILSHRNYMHSAIQAVGHSDYIEDQNGNGWLVSLGIRQMGWAQLHNLGRETLLTPLLWNEEKWPLVGNDGTTGERMEGPLPGTLKTQKGGFRDTFMLDELNKEWTFVRNPDVHRYTLDKGKMLLDGSGCKLAAKQPTWMGIRQKEFAVSAKASIKIKSLDSETFAGMSAYYNTDYYYAAGIVKENDTLYVRFVRCVHGDVYEHKMRLPERFLAKEELSIELLTDTDTYAFYIGSGKDAVPVGSGAAAGLASEGTRTMTFTGTFIGIFAESGKAIFTEFEANPVHK